MHHYRVTRPLAYNANTPGHTNPSARQGYYADAESPEKAARAVEVRLVESDFYGSGPSDNEFDVQQWDVAARLPAVRVRL